MTTIREKLSNFNSVEKSDFKPMQINKRSFLLVNTNTNNSSDKKRKSVYLNKANTLLFSHILSKQKDNKDNSSYNKIISLLMKEQYNRTKEENKEIGNYLFDKYYNFRLLKEKDEEKYDIIISICHLKKYLSNNIIINYEDILDKMYFLLEGKISVYKPIFITKLMTPEKFMRFLSLFNNKENMNKYNRINDKNKVIISEFNYNNKRKLQHFYVERNKKTGEIEEGQDFGGKIEDIEDIQNDNKISELMLKTEEDSLILFFNLNHYKKILDKIQRKKLKEEVEKFRNNFILFQHFSERKMRDIFKHISSQTLYQDEYLYHQNDNSEYIYFITKGKFCKYVSFSFNWLYDYLNYIKDSTTNIIYHLVNLSPKNDDKYDDLMSELEKKMLLSPMVNEHLSKIEKINEKHLEKYVYGVKLEEEKINNDKNIYRIKMENLGIGDIPGIEDGLELKNRFYSLKCISEIAEVKKIKIEDFLRIIKIYKNDNNYANNHLLDLIAKKKFYLYHQVIKNAQKLESNLTSNFNTKYNNLIENNEKIKSDKDIYLSIAAIKSKGYKYNIKEIFDKEIPIFPKIKKSISENYYERNQMALKNLYKDPTKEAKKLFKFKNQTRNLILTLSNPDYLTSNKSNEKYFFSEENFNSKKKINNDIYYSPKSILKSKLSISLSTNVSKAKSVKKIKKLKSKILGNKISEIKNEEKKYENSKNDVNLKKLKSKCIESLLSEQFGKINKKYYLGNEFKNKLDHAKKRFNLIKYKDYFNK